ncbi:MAG TPA: hypothetical protein VNW90_25295 [Acetobacteraceae bacterium]|jgi:hypothetical protein|nr:hypothetical protein [Acetobacteraceae bacterium]
MNTTAGYTNPIRSMERKLAPDYASREFRDPGLRTTRQSAGLGSLKHTMPHLQRSLHLQGGGGLSNPVGEIAAASHPNLYNPDPQFRQFLQLATRAPFSGRDLVRAPTAESQFVYQGGGEVDGPDDENEGQPPDLGEVQSPDDQMSSNEQQEREIVLNAMAALDGQSPDPEGDIKAFVQAFGPRALADLQQLLEQHHQQAQGEEGEEGGPPAGGQEDQEAEQNPLLQQAGGGLLHGQGTGQSDEIEGTTPSGRPVLLSDGEYVIDAPTVAALGDGSTKAGARRLDDLRKQIRTNAYGHDKQAKPMKKDKGGVTVVLK